MTFYGEFLSRIHYSTTFAVEYLEGPFKDYYLEVIALRIRKDWNISFSHIFILLPNGTLLKFDFANDVAEYAVAKPVIE